MKKFIVYKYISGVECWEIEASDEFVAKMKADIGDGTLKSMKEHDKNIEAYEEYE